MQKNYALLLAGLAIFCISGCNVINPPEVVPTYVTIDSFRFIGDTLRTGSASHRITNVYVYFNSAPVGVFDLPATFPVIATAPGTLTVVPGIDFDGLRGYEVNYPLYNGDSMHLTPAPGSKIHFTPTSLYNSSVALRFDERFNTTGLAANGFTKLSGDTVLLNTREASEVFEGAGSGVFRLPPGVTSAEVISTARTVIPAGKDAYIELNYKGNIPLRVGMNSLQNTGEPYTEYLIALKPQSQWTKIYIGIREFVGNHQGSEYHVLLRADKPSDVNDGVLLIDNVKIVSF